MTKPAAGKSPSSLLEPGIPAPDFKLPDQDGRERRLKDFRGQWVVLYFYPKDHTSGCTKEACQFRDGMGQFTRRKAVVIGVSPDSTQSHRMFVDKHQLPFLLLSDPSKVMMHTYGVWQEKNMYGRKYMGVVRTTYLIDPQGRVAQRWDKVKVPGHDQQVLARIAELDR